MLRGVPNTARAYRLRLASAVVCAGALLGGAAAYSQRSPRVESAYHDGKTVIFGPAPIKQGRVLVVGDTVVGPIAADRTPNDHRPNLYVVSPVPDEDTAGTYNLVLSNLPRTDSPVTWDVYWAVVLDPSLRIDVRSERELLIATQEPFAPGEVFDFGDIPGAALLRERLHIESVAGLANLRRPDGSLPRVAIVPAGYAVRASAVDPDAPPPESTISRALGKLSRKTAHEDGRATK